MVFDSTFDLTLAMVAEAVMMQEEENVCVICQSDLAHDLHNIFVGEYGADLMESCFKRNYDVDYVFSLDKEYNITIMPMYVGDLLAYEFGANDVVFVDEDVDYKRYSGINSCKTFRVEFGEE